LPISHSVIAVTVEDQGLSGRLVPLAAFVLPGSSDIGNRPAIGSVDIQARCTPGDYSRHGYRCVAKTS
jgi:hypothetical protein